MQEFTTIPPAKSTPLVTFDPAVPLLCIVGESYPENSFAFYAPINWWVKEYLARGDALHLEINVSYMNSSSTKCMLDLLDLFETAHRHGTRVAISWHYDKENPRSYDLAEEFQEEVSFPFTIVADNE